MPSASASVLPAVSVWPCAAVPLMVTVPVGASLTAVMLMVAVSEAVRFPPAPLLPRSLTASVKVSLAGGVSLLMM